MGSFGMLARRVVETEMPVMVQIQQLIRGAKNDVSLAQDGGGIEKREMIFFNLELREENNLHKSSVMVTAGANQMKDYIATPKPNSYQIFHTIVILFLYESMFHMEVQIRTREMNLIGERGVAAHYSGRGFVTDLVGHTVANGRSSGGKIICLNNANIALRVIKFYGWSLCLLFSFNSLVHFFCL